MIYLNYGKFENGVIVWNPQPHAFNPVRIENIKVSSRVSGLDARQVNYSHLLSRKDSWDISFSADELYNPVSLSFLHNLFFADAWLYGGYQYGYSGCAYGYGYSNVFLTNDGKFPVNFIESNVNLPEVKLNFIELNPQQ